MWADSPFVFCSPKTLDFSRDVHLLCVAVCRLYDGKILCDFANEIKSGAVSELVSCNHLFYRYNSLHRHSVYRVFFLSIIRIMLLYVC